MCRTATPGCQLLCSNILFQELNTGDVLLLLERARLIHLWIASRYALNAANNMFAKHCVSFFSIGQV